MANTIRIKRRASNGAVGAPTTLAPAEIAYNEADNTLYYGFGDGGVGFASSVIPVAGSGGFVTTGSTQTVSGPKTFSNITITGGSISGITDLAIADGGTGASTASGALTNLGAYPATNPNGYTTSVGTVTSVGLTVPTGLTITGSPVTTSGSLAVTLTSGYFIPTNASQMSWDAAFTQRLQWDGGATSLIAATGRTSLGATTVGASMFTLTNPTAITFPRFNVDNTVSALDAATFRTAIGAGTSSTTGTVTSVSMMVNTNYMTLDGGTEITTSGTFGIGFKTQAAATVFAGPATGAASSVGFRALVATDIPALNYASTGANSNITSLTGLTTALSIPQGGTGSTTAAAALTALGAYPATNPSNYSTTVGTVTSVAAVTLGTTGTDLTSTVATGTITPVITLNVPTASATNRGALSSADWTSFNTSYTSRISSLTTSGSSGAATLTSNALNVPAYTLSGLGGQASSANLTSVAGLSYVSSSFVKMTSAGTFALDTTAGYLPSSGGTVSGALVVTGNLTVQGATTAISSNTLTVQDKNIELAVGNALESGATGGGITLHGLVDHTILYTTGTSSWDFSEHMNLVTGKAYKINGVSVLSATALDGVVVDGGTF